MHATPGSTDLSMSQPVQIPRLHSTSHGLNCISLFTAKPERPFAVRQVQQYNFYCTCMSQSCVPCAKETRKQGAQTVDMSCVNVALLLV